MLVCTTDVGPNVLNLVLFGCLSFGMHFLVLLSACSYQFHRWQRVRCLSLCDERDDDVPLSGSPPQAIWPKCSKEGGKHAEVGECLHTPKRDVGGHGSGSAIGYPHTI